MSLRSFFQLLKRAAVAWQDDNASTLGAALAYYTVFSLAPLLLIAVSVAGLIVGEDAARAEMIEQIRPSVGSVAADAIAALLESTERAGGTVGMTLVGLTALLLGASGAFVQLQEALNLIWKTTARPRTENVVVHFLRHRLLSFAAVLGTGLLLLVLFVVSIILAAIGKWLAGTPVAGNSGLWQALFALVSFGFATLLFALVYKVLPDAPIVWRDVWLGALLTAALFTLGQHLIGLYIGKSSVASSYGAAGSFAVLLAWVYYSAQIVLFGAEFTYVYATTRGSHASKKPAQASGK
jgi:membrane protein